MMCDTTGTTVDLVRKVVEAVPVPVTVKMRLGWDDDNRTAPFFAREFEKVGVAAITIHGRTREQGFSGGVNHDRHPPRGRGGRDDSRSSATATCGRSPTRPG